MNLDNSKVLVTGGASFIGSHLTHALVERGASVRVVDNLSSGQLSNIQTYVESGQVEFVQADLTDPGIAQRAVDGVRVVFHLAADHGGRGYVELHQAACATNLALDGMLFRACHQAGVEKVVYASSGCVYPNHLQTDPGQLLFLTEDMVGPPCDADNGEQIRNWTHVDDIVAGTIKAAENIDDGTAINLGTMERTRVIDAVHEVLRYTGHSAEIELHPEMPTGPMNRVADNSLGKQLLDWEPEVRFMDGLRRTIDWYFSTKDKNTVVSVLEERLTER